MESHLKCPKCGSVIYSRRIPVCGRCGEELPAALMFDPKTRKRIESEIEQDQERRDWEARFPEPGQCDRIPPF